MQIFKLEEAWRRRPNGGVGIFTDTADLYWISINNPEDSEENPSRFSELTPHTAFNLIKKHINPLKGGLIRKRDGSFSAQIPRSEVELALEINQFDDKQIKITKDPFMNRRRGKVWHPDIKKNARERNLRGIKRLSCYESNQKNHI